MEPVSKALGVLNISVAAFARRLGVQPPTVHEWMNGGREIPPKRAIQIEQETEGRVTRADCRPKDYLELWPEFDAGRGQHEERA